jgi:hypothetical protein
MGHGAWTQSHDNLPRRAKAATAQLGTFISNCQTFKLADAGAIPPHPHPHVSKVSEVAYGPAIAVAVGLCVRMGVCEHRLRAHLIIPQHVCELGHELALLVSAVALSLSDGTCQLAFNCRSTKHFSLVHL